MHFNRWFAPQLHSTPTLGSATWLLHLRWVAVIGQLLTIAVSIWGIGVELPATGLLGLVGITAATNIGLAGYLRWLEQTKKLHADDRLDNPHGIVAVMLLDMAVLTWMLYLSGGPTNPFLFFYFVNIAIGGVVLSAVWGWLLVAMAVAGVIILLTAHYPVEVLSRPWDEPSKFWSVQQIAFFVAFATCSLVVTYFIRVLTDELKRREMQLREAQDQRARSRRLEALATLAAGAGHELATPLSTIAVVAKEMSRSLSKIQAPDSLRQDLTLIQEELQRCRVILDQMKAGAGEASAERMASVPARRLVEEILVGLREPNRVRVTVAPEVDTQEIHIPLQAVAQALRNIVQNAIDASQPAAEVFLSITPLDEECLKIEVIDRGDGMPVEVQQRIGEPFFTTKEPGKGTGLGLYLTHNVLNRLGGSLSFSSRVGYGTTATVELPVVDE